MLKIWLKNSPYISRINARVKARFQERRASYGLARYQRIARKKRIQILDREPLEQALRQRIARRRTRCAPKPKGELHIFLAYAVANWEAILPATLRPFGRVSAFDWKDRGYDDRHPDWIRERRNMNEEMLESFHEANGECPVDAVVGYLSGHNVAPETLQEIAQTGAVIFNFCWDDKLNFPGNIVGGRFDSPAAIAHAVDLNLTNAPDSVAKYAVHDGLAMFWPEAAHPDVHRPYDLPFEFDVSFVGARYGWRPDFVRRLSDFGVDVECFGRGWPNGPLSDEDMVKLYSRSRINLGFGGIGYSRKLMCLKGRDFEVPMSGGLYLTQDNPELNRVFDVGREILTYQNEFDCAEKIKYLLANPSQATAIRAAGRARCLREHTYEARWTQVFFLTGIMH